MNRVISHWYLAVLVLDNIDCPKINNCRIFPDSTWACETHPAADGAVPRHQPRSSPILLLFVNDCWPSMFCPEFEVCLYTITFDLKFIKIWRTWACQWGLQQLTLVADLSKVWTTWACHTAHSISHFMITSTKVWTTWACHAAYHNVHSMVVVSTWSWNTWTCNYGLQQHAFDDCVNQSLDHVSWQCGFQQHTFGDCFIQDLDNVSVPVACSTTHLVIALTWIWKTWACLSDLQCSEFGVCFDQGLDNVKQPRLATDHILNDFNQRRNCMQLQTMRLDLSEQSAQLQDATCVLRCGCWGGC